jgi:ankyrin repeat protein
MESSKGDYGHVDVVKELIKCGADLDRADNGGFTALFHAVGGGNIDVVKALLEAGADRAKAVNGGVATPLWLAEIQGKAGIAALLE